MSISSNTSDSFSSSDSSDIPVCVRCSEPLDTETLDYCTKHLDLLEEIGSGYLCREHWSECMPQSTPWNYVIGCNICGESICKSCKTETKGGGIICTTCREQLGDRW